jgi:hypothetical protein
MPSLRVRDRRIARALVKGPCRLGARDRERDASSCRNGRTQEGREVGIVRRGSNAVGSGQSPLSTFQSVGFSGPSSEPDVRLSPHPALHESKRVRTWTFMPRWSRASDGCAPVEIASGRHRCRVEQRQRSLLRPPPVREASPSERFPVEPAGSLPPSPCGRLSRQRTTPRAPPHPGTVSRRRTCPPPPWLGGGEGDPEMVPTFTMHRSTGRWPALLLQPRHWYAAGLPRGLPTDVLNRLRSRPPTRGGRALLPGPHPPGWSRRAP